MVRRHYRTQKRRLSRHRNTTQAYKLNPDVVDLDDGSHRSMIARRYLEAVKANRIADAKLYEYVYFNIYTSNEVKKKPDYTFWFCVLVFLLAIYTLNMR